jgi:tetratricopeptide (TPR) repeat protein
MRLIQILFLLSWLAGVPNSSFAALEFNENCRLAYRQILRADFKTADKLMAQERKTNPENAMTDYLQNMQNCIEVMIHENKVNYLNYKDKKAYFVSKLEKENKTPLRNFLLAETHLQWAFAKVRMGDYFSAVLDFNRAYGLANDNQKQFPSFRLNNKPLGILHVLVGTVPDEFKWIFSIIGFKGSIQQGLSELKQVAEYSEQADWQCFQEEILFYRLILTANFQKGSKESVELVKSKKSISQQNPFTLYATATILTSDGKNDEAIQMIENQHQLRKQVPQLNFLLGSLKLYRLDNDAVDVLKSYALEYGGNSYIKSCWQKISWHYFVHNDLPSFEQAREMIKVKGNQMTDEDKTAMKEAEHKLTLNQCLLKARLLFDGAYFNQAQQALADCRNEDLVSTRDKIEFLYRSGRIHHGKGDWEKALKSYQKTSELSRNANLYYGANAALLAGNIYEESNRNKEAAEQYQLALSFKGIEYQRSIHNKAKAGLKRLSEQKAGN